jgi:citrate synthase
MTEGMLFLLVTGELPTHEEVEDLRLELITRARLPAETIALMQSLPSNIPSLTQLSMGLLSLQTHSHFAKAYTQGIKKSEYWKPIFEDSLDLIARLPVIAAYIYKTKYRPGPVGRIDEQLDWAANFGNMIGFHDRTLHEFLRMYTIIHSDNSGGNVSAHATHLVGSALADPYLSYSAGLNGLSGPLHGLAGQAFMKWLISARSELGDKATEARLEAYVRKTLEAGKRIPAFGHEVLKVEDPRFLCQKDFALTYAGNDPLCRMVNLCHRVIPKVLKEVMKVEHPWPNLYAYTGAILHHYGISEYEYFSVLFGVSRAIGCMSQLMWSRGLGMPIERPGSVNVEILRKLTS